MFFSKINTVYKLACLLISTLAAGTLMWTNSRSGWISLGMAVLFMGFLIVSRIRGKKAFISAFLTAVLILILIFPLYPRLYNKIYGRFAGDDGGSAQSRLPQFEIAYNIIKNNPILGIGINNYSEVMWKYDVTEGGLRELSVYPVHNIYLHLAAEIGIFGFAMFMLILTIIFYKGINYVILNSGFEAYVVIGLLAGILAFLIHGLSDVASIGSKMFMFVWFFAGIIFGVNEIDPERKDVSA
jgi:O-antigen ligase